jgi:hypothetical protein
LFGIFFTSEKHWLDTSSDPFIRIQAKPGPQFGIQPFLYSIES